MAPSIDGEVHTFAEHGLYDGLFLMKDDQTGTYWDHMTGDAVYGPLVGESLEVTNLLQTNVAQVLGVAPDARIALSDQAIRRDSDMKLDGLLGGIRRGLNRMFSSTVEREDDRRPTMDLGMGIWQGDASRYYPYDAVMAADRAIVDTFRGQRVVVYLDPTAFALAALYIGDADVEWDEDVLRLSDGRSIEGGVLRDASGEPIEANRPLQVFTRWYGFSLTFPGTEIYGQS